MTNHHTLLSINLDHDVTGWTVRVQSTGSDALHDYANVNDAIDATLLLVGLHRGPALVHIVGGDVVVYATAGNA